MTDDARPVLLLDFDGTVCVGDAPVWAYAEAVISALLDDPDAAGHGRAVRERLGAFLDGDPSSPAYIDGYAAVAELSAGRAAAEQLQCAYAASRRQLANGELDVTAPAGLADLLDELAPRVRRVLVTNAPADGVSETLEKLGLADRLDHIVTAAGKPAGWDVILPPLLASRPPAAMMAIGDIWTNDLEPALAAGCCTGLIDRFGHRAGPAHATAATLEDLYPAVREWAADPLDFAARHAPARQEASA